MDVVFVSTELSGLTSCDFQITAEAATNYAPGSLPVTASECAIADNQPFTGYKTITGKFGSIFTEDGSTAFGYLWKNTEVIDFKISFTGLSYSNLPEYMFIPLIVPKI